MSHEILIACSYSIMINCLYFAPLKQLLNITLFRFLWQNLIFIIFISFTNNLRFGVSLFTAWFVAGTEKY